MFWPVWHAWLTIADSNLKEEKKEIKFFFIVFCSLPGMAGDLKSRPFRPIGPSHFDVVLECFYRLFGFRSHLWPSICEAVLLGFENWCVFIHSNCYLKWKKIYSPKIVFTIWLAQAGCWRPYRCDWNTGCYGLYYIPRTPRKWWPRCLMRLNINSYIDLAFCMYAFL